MIIHGVTDSHVIMSTVATAAMLEVYCLAAVSRLLRTVVSRVELYCCSWRTWSANNLAISISKLSHFNSLVHSIPPTWRHSEVRDTTLQREKVPDFFRRYCRQYVEQMHIY